MNRLETKQVKLNLRPLKHRQAHARSINSGVEIRQYADETHYHAILNRGQSEPEVFERSGGAGISDAFDHYLYRQFQIEMLWLYDESLYTSWEGIVYWLPVGIKMVYLPSRKNFSDGAIQSLMMKALGYNFMKTSVGRAGCIPYDLHIWQVKPIERECVIMGEDELLLLKKAGGRVTDETPLRDMIEKEKREKREKQENQERTEQWT